MAVFKGPCCIWSGDGVVWGEGDVEFAISSDVLFLNIYVINIHHILAFQTSGDT